MPHGSLVYVPQRLSPPSRAGEPQLLKPVSQGRCRQQEKPALNEEQPRAKQQRSRAAKNK